MRRRREENGHGGALERRLIAERPAPRHELVSAIADRVRRAGLIHSASQLRQRVALAGAVTATVATVFTTLGGVGYAASAAQEAGKAVAKAATQPPSLPSGDGKDKDKGGGNPPTTTGAAQTTTAAPPAAPPAQTTTAVAPAAEPTASASSSSSSSNNGKKKDKVKICHATGSASNPYVEIEVSENGLNGHDDHDGDIIPAPGGGCGGGAPPAEDQYKPGKGCGDKNHVRFNEGKCKEKKDKDKDDDDDDDDDD